MREIYRLRPGLRTDTYSQKEVRTDWDHPDIVPLPGGFIAQTSTSMLRSESREQALESKSLFCEGELDVEKGDRIRDGEEGAPIYTIDGIPPTADSNPFTGWMPPREIPLTRSVG